MDPNSLMPTDAPSWLAEYGSHITLLASFVAILVGGCTLWKLINAGRIKRKEEIAKQQPYICGEVLRLLGELKSMLGDHECSDMLRWMATNKTWIQNNEVFLPCKFVECWNLAKKDIRRAQRLYQKQEQMVDDEKRGVIANEYFGIRDSCVELIKDVDKDIRRECGLPPS